MSQKPKLDKPAEKKSVERVQAETQEKSFADLSVEDLKCMSYDELVILEALSKQIEQLNKQIGIHQGNVRELSKEIRSRPLGLLKQR